MRRLNKAIGALTAFLVIGAAGVAAADVTVFRGRAVEIVVTGQTGGAPTVLRGGGSVIAPLSAPAPGPKVARAQTPRIVAGRTLWLVDSVNRRLTACYLRGTGTFNRRRIVCTRY